MFVVYFDHLSGAACTQKLVELFFQLFQPFVFFLNIFQWIFVCNQEKMCTSLGSQPGFACWPALGSGQRQKAGPNTQHMFEPGTHNGIFLIHLELLYRAWFYFCTDENKRKSKLDLAR